MLQEAPKQPRIRPHLCASVAPDKTVAGHTAAGQTRFDLHDASSPARAQLERAIADKYQLTHQATLSEFLPLLINMSSNDVDQAIIGLAPAGDNTLFLEQYFDMTIEQNIAGIAGQPINRNSIVEVGSLAVNERGAGLVLFLVIAAILHEAGFQWMVFTVTAQVRKLIARLDFDPHCLVEADPDRLTQGRERWGNYYQRCPQVMAGSLIKAMAIAKENSLLASILQLHQKDITRIANQLVPVRYRIPKVNRA